MTAKQTNRESASPSFRDRAGEAYEDARERAIEAYEETRERASAASSKVRDGLGEAPLLTLGGGLALGALLAALLPKTRAEDKIFGQVGGKITGSAKAAAEAAREAGRERLAELNITRDAGASAMQSLIQGIGEAAKVSGQAALGAVRKKD